MSVTAGPFNLLSGFPTNVQPSGNLGIYKAVAIYNNSSSVLTMSIAGQQDILPSNVGQIYTLPPTATPIAVTPQNVQPIAGYAVGTVSATFYFEEDVIPAGFPISLPPFPGGAELMYSLSTGPVSAPATLNGTIDVQLPNSGLVNLSIFSSGLQAGTFEIVGLQSNTVYFNNIGGNATFNVSAQITKDTSVAVTYAVPQLVGSITGFTISASPSPTQQPSNSTTLQGVCGVPMFSYISEQTASLVIDVPAVPSGCPLLVCAWTSNNAPPARTISTITDTFGTSYAYSAVQNVSDANDSACSMFIGLRAVATPGASESGTVTVNFSGAGWYNGCVIPLISAPFGNTNTAAVIDTSGTNTGIANATWTGPNLVPAHSFEVGVYMIGQNGFDAEYLGSGSPPANWTFIPVAFTGPPVSNPQGLLIRQRCPAVAQAPSVTFSGGAPDWSAIGAFFLNA